MDFIYKNDTGEIKAIFPHTHGVVQNVGSGESYIALETDRDPQDLAENFYIENGALVEKMRLDIYWDNKKIKVRKLDHAGNEISTGTENIKLFLYKENETTNIVSENTRLDDIDLTLIDGKVDKTLNNKDSLKEVNVYHPHFVCHAVAKIDKGEIKIINGVIRRVPTGIKEWVEVKREGRVNPKKHLDRLKAKGYQWLQ